MSLFIIRMKPCLPHSVHSYSVMGTMSLANAGYKGFWCVIFLHAFLVEKRESGIEEIFGKQNVLKKIYNFKRLKPSL